MKPYYQVNTRRGTTTMPFFLSFKKIILALICILSLFIGSLLLLFLAGAPPLHEETTIILDQDGTPMITNANDKALEFAEIPTKIIQTTIATEDKAFYSHYGFDLKGIIRATYQNIRSKSKKEGASTITQQLAKNLYLTNDKTWKRKIIELVYALRLELFYDKEEILAAYVNTIYYGHGIYGLHHASAFFFGKTVDELSNKEIALIVGIPKGPTYYSPYQDMENAKKRMTTVLQHMVDANIITDQAYEQAFQDDLHMKPKDRETENTNYFTDAVWEEAATVLNMPIEILRQNGLTITSTYDPSIQKSIEKAVSAAIPDQASLQVSALSLDPQSGAVGGLVGGRDYGKSPFNRAIHAKRMVGSTFKPFVYYTALENGFTAASMLRSEPTTFFSEETPYKPTNYANQYANGPITLAQALAVSDNIYAVKTQYVVGTETVIQTAKQFGIHAQMDPTPALALGTASISLLEMTNAYGIIANRGKETTPHFIQEIRSKNGTVLYEKKVEDKQIFSQEKMYILQELMKGMFNPAQSDYLAVTGRSMLPRMTQTYAGKSGTTDFDHWMIGFTPTFVTGVWVGYDQPKQINKQAETQFAKNIWLAIMEENKVEEKQEETPAIVEWHDIDLQSGLLASTACQKTVSLPFEKGTEPRKECEETARTSADKQMEQPLFRRVLHWVKRLFTP